MSKSFENRRNGFIQNLRSELIRKSSMIIPSEEKIVHMRLPSIKQIEIARSSFPRYRNSVQIQNANPSETITSIDFNRNLKNLIGVKNLRHVKALFMARDGLMRTSIYEPSQLEIFRGDSTQKRMSICGRERFKKIVNLVIIILKLINMHKISKEKIQKFGNEIKVNNLYWL